MFPAQWSTTETGETRLRREVVAESRRECREPRDRLFEPRPAPGRSQAPWGAQIVSMMSRESYHARESARESSYLRETERRKNKGSGEPSPARGTSSCSRAHSRAQDTHPVSHKKSKSARTCARHTTYRRSRRAVMARRDKQREAFRRRRRTHNSPSPTAPLPSTPPPPSPSRSLARPLMAFAILLATSEHPPPTSSARTEPVASALIFPCMSRSLPRTRASAAAASVPKCARVACGC